MAILVHANTRVICQGITGSFGAVHTKGCHLYGTKMPTACRSSTPSTMP
jgi:succinyl-CoA synthetase alpha subunit